MGGRDLAKALRNGQKVFGTCIISPSPHWPPMIKNLGLDFVFIDTEHIPLDREQLSWMCRTYKALDLVPIVRIPKPDPSLATCALDGGACGLIAPYIETVEQVKQLRGAVKLRPLKGKRLEDALNGVELEKEVKDYLEEANKDNLLIINIESIPGIAALDEILKVPDLDAILIGPHDLSINLGIPEQWKHPKFDNAVKEIIRKTRAQGIGVGIHHSFGITEEISWIQYGANLVLHASDLVAVREKLTEDFLTIKNAIHHTSSTKKDKQSQDVVHV